MSSSGVYNSCLADLGEEASDRALMECLAEGFSNDSSRAYSRSVLLVLAAALVFFMQAGFAM